MSVCVSNNESDVCVVCSTWMHDKAACRPRLNITDVNSVYNVCSGVEWVMLGW